MTSRAIVKTKYTREFEGQPMILSEGDSITVLKKNQGKYKEWYWCRSSDGIEAWVPEAFMIIRGDSAQVTRNYNSSELSVEAGENVVIEYSTGGWAWCTNSKLERGWIPMDNINL